MAVAKRWNKTPWKDWPRWPGKPPVMYAEKKPEAEPLAPSAPPEVKNDVIFYVVGPKDDPVSDLEWELTYPDGQTTTGTLGNDGRVNHTSVPMGTYQLKLKVLWGAMWGSSELEVDEPTSLSAHADAFEPGTSGEFEVFDGRGVQRKPIATVSATVSDAKVLEADWTPAADVVEDVTSGTLVFRAKIGSAVALSEPAVISVRHTFELEDDEGALADTTVVARFSDGHEIEEEVKEGKLDVLVPLGQELLWIDLPEHPGAHLTIHEEGVEPREYLLRELPRDGAGDSRDSGASGDSGEGDASEAKESEDGGTDDDPASSDGADEQREGDGDAPPDGPGNGDESDESDEDEEGPSGGGVLA